MTISETAAIAVGDRLFQLVREYTGDRRSLLELLWFWVRYPRARFSKLALVHALDSQKLFVEKGLTYLIDKGVVTTYIENKIPLYSLTEDGSLLRPVLEIAKLDWFEWQLVCRHIYPACTDWGVSQAAGPSEVLAGEKPC